ncbi:MAG: DUF2157 domain-containing protein [Candidatus Sumerlaeota bacterium]|nr:DUF2157 domain-containing protein [Candidatus Sumerlaeota bacterium]
MTSFIKNLERLLSEARGKLLIDEPTSAALLQMAETHERGRGVLSVAGVLGGLGGFVALLGVGLLIASNWDEIGGGAKIGGLLLLLLGTHGLGFWIRETGRPYPRTSEALHFLGAGLFLAGIVLIAQIYHLNAHGPNAILLWLAAIVPLAVLLRSPSIVWMSIAALLWWAHWEGASDDSPLRMPDYVFTPHLMIEIGLGAALVGFSGMARAAEPRIAHVFRVAGALLLFLSLYLLGFYRHFSPSFFHGGKEGSVILPAGALLAGAGGMLLGFRRLAIASPWLRNRLLVFLGCLLALGAAALAADAGAIPRGPSLAFVDFGREGAFDTVEWVVSAAAWILWFLLAFWCVAFGTRARRKDYVNLGVLAVGLGAVTRFFDLIGSLATTGFFFLAGGIILLATGWAMERWRRNLVARMEAQS